LTRKDVIIVASVSCIYGIGSPEFYQTENISFTKNQSYDRSHYSKALHKLQYTRNDTELKRGTYSLRGDTLEIFPAYENNTVRIKFFGNLVESIESINWITGQKIRNLDSYEVFPAKHFITPDYLMADAIKMIKTDLKNQIDKFQKAHKLLEAQRIKERTNYDLEMIEMTGYCSGIENYSRYFDGRTPGQPPITLLDYFPDDFLTVIDESHMTIPQIQGMYAGDLSRKQKLVDFGFRLPSAYDNRPLKFDEFYQKINQSVFTSATPADFEFRKSNIENSVLGKKQKYDAVIKQFIRPTGLLDPTIEIRTTKNQIENLVSEIETRINQGERVLVTTLTKKMAEALSEFLNDKKIKVAYIHSDVETLERSKILHALRLGEYDVLVGINLLREGLDLPEVSLVAILDADKEGFLRSKTALIQTFGRAARHINGKVILYADIMTKSIKGAIAETDARRSLQEKFNRDNLVTPKGIKKEVKPKEVAEEKKLLEIDHAFKKLAKSEKRKVILDLTLEMKKAAQLTQFERAAEIRDQVSMLENLL